MSQKLETVPRYVIHTGLILNLRGQIEKMKESLDKIGGLGSIISAMAAAAPCCVPFLASIAGTVGLGSLLPYSGYIVYLVQLFGILAVVGAIFSFKKHRKIAPLILTVVCVATLIFVYNVSLVAWLLYSGLVGLVIAAIWNTLESKRCNQCPAPA